MNKGKSRSTERLCQRANQSILSLMNNSSDSDDDSTLGLMRVLLALQKSSGRSARKSRGRKAAKKQNKKSAKPRKCDEPTVSNSTILARSRKHEQQTVPNSTICLESEEEIIDPKIGESHLKNIENKVNEFFKSSNLLSDDEDDIELNLKKKIEEPTKNTKDFYAILSDSEDETTLGSTKVNSFDMPSTSGLATYSKENNKLLYNSENQLMDIVDNILDSNDELQNISKQDQSWEEYKKKTEEMLGSVSALIDGFKKNDNEMETKKPEENICSNIEGPTCPICLEKLGGSVVTAATFCGHMFCQECITHVAKTTKKCPTCRKNVNLKKIHPVYL